MRLPTAADTQAFGARLATSLRAGDLVLLTGPLGAGKTALTQGIGAGLGVSGRVVSPTFVIARVHRGGRLPLVHVDAYRLGSLVEVDDLDLDVDVADSVTVVEWGAGLVEQLSDERLEIALTRSDDSSSEERSAILIAHGPEWSARLPDLLAGLVAAGAAGAAVDAADAVGAVDAVDAVGAVDPVDGPDLDSASD